MKIGAIIAEFNPFHAGHKYIIDKIREDCDAVIAIMSGNFVQRGECSIFDKAERTRVALQRGVDLVLELPCVYALSSAEGFSRGAVSILNATGVIDSLYFGSECGDIKILTGIAKALNNETPAFKNALEEKLREGASFPAARNYALSKTNPDAEALNMPNNILAVEYIRALDKLSSQITPCTIKRLGSGYNDTEIKEGFASASAIRALLSEGRCADSFTDCKGTPLFMKDFDMIVSSRVKSATKEELCAVPDCNDELASRILSATKHNSFTEIVADVSCKNYTQSRIRRILCNLIIGNRFSSIPDPTYMRVLGFSKTGSEILTKMKSTTSLPVIARGALLKDDAVFNLECRATDIYNLTRGIPGGKEFSFTPIYF